MGRAPCCEKAHTNKGAWSKDEDQRLVDYIRVHGEGCWRSLPKAAGLMRCGKSCRLRWINYLRPDLKRGNFTNEDDELIIKLHASLGNRWSQIAAQMPGRTDNEIKNYWNTHIRRKLLGKGRDPQTHSTLTTSENSSSGVTSDDQLDMLPKPAKTTTTTTTTTTTAAVVPATTFPVKEEPLDLELSLAVMPSNNQSHLTTDSADQRQKFCLSCRAVFTQRLNSAECSICKSPFFRYL